MGQPGLDAVATHPDAEMVMAALVGAAGLAPTLSAIRSGKTIALANKEALVISGELMTREARHYGVKILPVDSDTMRSFRRCTAISVVKSSGLFLLLQVVLFASPAAGACRGKH